MHSMLHDADRDAVLKGKKWYVLDISPATTNDSLLDIYILLRLSMNEYKLNPFWVMNEICLEQFE